MNEKQIMPDYEKWRMVYFRLDYVCAAVTFLMECIFFVCLYYAGLIKETVSVYLFLYLVLPTALNLLILYAAHMARRWMPQQDMRQNFIPVFALVLITMVISVTHCVFFTALCIYCIPICMTALFNNKRMCRLITCISIAGVAMATVKHFLTAENVADRTWAIPEGVIAVCILLLVDLVSKTLLDMTDGQKEKLIASVKDARETRYRAEAANIAKSAFLANMSHEIRTPINAILGMNEMILRENENEQITEYANNIQAAGNSLLYLVNDVLDISKIESGKLDIVEVTYETSSFIHDCCSMIAERAAKKGLEFYVDCSPELPSRLRGDEIRFRQVVTNLLSNACKYTEKGSISLLIDSRREQEQFFLAVTVKDTGIGIKEENVKNLFTQFTRFDLEKNRNIQGTGLGLAITKQLTDLMNGDIRVQSIYGVGTSFTVTIPQQVIDPAPMGDFHRRYRDVSRENAKYQQKFEAPGVKILVVDDVEVNLKVIVNLLKKTKIRVDTALNGKQCIAMAEQNAYDIILMDHMMPEMNGVETYAKIKESPRSLNRNTPVIMLTANAISGVREEYLKSGFADYLSKPVLGDKLEEVILKYLPEGKIRTIPELPAEETGSADKDTTVLDAAVEGTDHVMMLQRLFHAYPQADLTLGLSYCGQNVDVYISVLQTFARRSKDDVLEGCYEKKDVENYQILIHGIKSASLSVGFAGLSEKARALEEAAKSADWDYIEEHHASFVTEYQNAVSAVLKTIS